jgi:hypothetical protein
LAWGSTNIAACLWLVIGGDKKGLRYRISPIYTLSQNGYGASRRSGLWDATSAPS